MNSLEALLGMMPPPARLKVYAPNGDTKEVIAYLCIRNHRQDYQLTELVLRYEDDTIEVLSKKVVVEDLETGKVCYNPRTAPGQFGDKMFISGSEKFWLQQNPHWPAVLELQDSSVEEKESEGLSP